ncbi:MAG: hypothetical protein ACOX5R_13850 [bacterium]|jgi:hypothetical protein
MEAFGTSLFLSIVAVVLALGAGAFTIWYRKRTIRNQGFFKGYQAPRTYNDRYPKRSEMLKKGTMVEEEESPPSQTDRREE